MASKRRMWFKPENTQPASTVPFLPRAWALNWGLGVYIIHKINKGLDSDL